MNLILNTTEKLKEKIAMGLMVVAGVLTVGTCWVLMYEEETPQDIKASINRF